jgi:hypothetical protein
MVNVPAGVPLFDPTFGNPPPEHPLIYPTEISSNANAPIGTNRLAVRFPNLAALASAIISVSKIANVNSHIGRAGFFGLDGGAICANPRAVVVIVIVVGLPAETDDGLNDALAPVGKPLALNVIWPEKVPPIGAVAIVYVPEDPAGTVCVVVVAVTLKSPLIVNVSAFEVMPDGAPCGRIPFAPLKTTVGVNTVTEAVPAVAISAAVIAAVNCVELTNVVVRLLPFHCATEVLMKLLPFKVSVNAAPPAVAEFGVSEVSTGIGVVTLNCETFDVPPPGAGFTTLTKSMFAV